MLSPGLAKGTSLATLRENEELMGEHEHSESSEQ